MLSGAVLLGALGLFAWGRVRHDLVAVLALAACLLLGLVATDKALVGFSDPAVVVVAAVLIIGRAVELTGVAELLTERLARLKVPFVLQLSVLLIAAAGLSAFMNNVAALAIAMPAVAGVCQAARRPVGAGLMPLAFATILGGMTTLVGTPANLILSSVREEQVGAPFGLFDVSPVGVTVAVAGVAFLCLIGWRLMPKRRGERAEAAARFTVYELIFSGAHPGLISLGVAARALRPLSARVLGLVRENARRDADRTLILQPDDRLLVLGRNDPWSTARRAGLGLRSTLPKAEEGETVRVVVSHGSPLIGRPYAAVAAETDGQVQVAGGGPRAARAKAPLGEMLFQTGDQVSLHGPARRVARFARYARLVEVERRPLQQVSPLRASATLAIYAAAVAASVGLGLPTALTFVGAAALIPALGLMPKASVYSAIDWPAIVLLAAMIPVGRSFQTSGAAEFVAGQLGAALSGTPLWAAAAAMVTVTLLLSAFLNNVATAIIVGPIAVDVARTLNAPPDALLLAVLVGASSAFLTPIGHQNNLLVMGPGGYRFADYVKAGALLSLVVIVSAAAMIGYRYG